MKLSSGWEQSIFVLLTLSRLPERGTLTSQALAERLNVSPSYLKKIVKSLVNEGLIHSSSGRKGGFSLAKPLADISFYKVFVAIEGRSKVFASQHLLHHFLNLPKNEVDTCAITNALDAVENSLVTTMSTLSLAQLAQQISDRYMLDDLDSWIRQQL